MTALFYSHFYSEPLYKLSVIHCILKRFNMLTQQKQRPCDKTDEGSKIEKWEIFRKKTKKTRNVNKLKRWKGWKGLCLFRKREDGKRGTGKKGTPAHFWGHYSREWLPFVPPWHFRGSLITQERGAGRGEQRESPPQGSVVTAWMIRHCYNNEKSRVKITGHWVKGGGAMWHSRADTYTFLNVLSVLLSTNHHHQYLNMSISM